MRSITRLTLSALVAVAVSGPAHAADMFLRLGPVKGENAAARKGKESSVEVLSWQYGTARKGWDGSIKGGSASPRNSAPSGARNGSASSDRNSVRVKVKFPWLDCRVGDRITDATLVSSTERVTFADISVSRCAADEIDLDYASVIVRALDPATKQE